MRAVVTGDWIRCINSRSNSKCAQIGATQDCWNGRATQTASGPARHAPALLVEARRLVAAEVEALPVGCVILRGGQHYCAGTRCLLPARLALSSHSPALNVRAAPVCLLAACLTRHYAYMIRHKPAAED
jgi:hypothetical protein